MASRLISLLLTGCAAATISLPEPAPASASAPLSFPITQHRYTTTNTKLKRAIDLDVQVFNVSSISYLIELGIGDPRQTVKVAIDTGSSELWVNPNCRTAQTQVQAQECSRNGRYDPSLSSTAQISRKEGRVKYGIGEVELRYVSDSISLPNSDINLKGVTFGYATSSVDLNQGILGLSFGMGFNLNYPTFLDELVLQNVSQTHSLSVALGSKDEKAHSGLLTFGGIDTKKYKGQLHTSPILEPRSDEGLYRYWVSMSSMGVTKAGQSPKTFLNSSIPVFFDTGATLCYLPTSIVSQLVTDLNGKYDRRVGLYTVECGQKGSIDFTFGNFTVNVAMEEFIWKMDNGQCAIGAEGTDDGGYILGDSFLRSVYAVFDMDSPSIHFAHYVNCGSNLQTIPKGKNAAASFIGECSQKDVDDANNRSDDDDDEDNAAGRLDSRIAWLVAGSFMTAQLLFILL